MIKMPHNSLDAFQIGAILDMRVRLAMDMLIHNPSFTDAGVALQEAYHLFDLADEKGLMDEIPEKMEQRLRDHAYRGAQFQAEQRRLVSGNQIMNDAVTDALKEPFKGPRNTP